MGQWAMDAPFPLPSIAWKFESLHVAGFLP